MALQQENAVAYTNDNLPLGIGAGVIAALLGAAIWMAVTVLTGMHIGYVALGIGAGVIAALLGAAIWMAVTVLTGMHIGYVALGIGALVGYAIRVAGKGSTMPFGIAGAVLTLFGCLLGQAAAEIQLAAKAAGVTFFQALPAIDAGALASGILQSTGPITYFIYAIGIYEGYKLSMNR